MSVKPHTMLRQPDVVTLLHREFGPLLSWRDFLADCIRSGTTFHGLSLLPAAYIRDRGRRPAYLKSDVDLFILEIGKIASPAPVEQLTVMVDISVPWIPARARRAVVIGSAPMV